MRFLTTVGAVALSMVLSVLSATEATSCTFKSWPAPVLTRSSEIPFKNSTFLKDITYAEDCCPTYAMADTWYPSWGADDRLYTPWTDGAVGEHHSGSGGVKSTTGYAVISGDDPFNLTFDDVGVTEQYNLAYGGRYPSGSLMYKGVWYYMTYMLDDYQEGVNPPPDCYNWCVQGPLVGFRTSTDFGKTWNEPRFVVKEETDNLFGENAKHNLKVKFGAPHVVDFGKEMQHSPDGKMYIIAHGAQRSEAHESWMQGDSVYMARTVPSVDTINDASTWEFFAGRDENGDIWKAGDVSAAQPLFTWENHTGVVTMTYVPVLGKYLMFVGTPTFSPIMSKSFNFYVLESDSITGPFNFVQLFEQFGPEAYFVNMPSKFIAKNVVISEDGSYLEAFLSYSANWADHDTPNPSCSGYHWSLLKLRLNLL